MIYTLSSIFNPPKLGTCFAMLQSTNSEYPPTNMRGSTVFSCMPSWSLMTVLCSHCRSLASFFCFLCLCDVLRCYLTVILGEGALPKNDHVPQSQLILCHFDGIFIRIWGIRNARYFWSLSTHVKWIQCQRAFDLKAETVGNQQNKTKQMFVRTCWAAACPSWASLDQTFCL